MTMELIKIKACKGEVAAEAEIPLSLIDKDPDRWGIENILHLLYKAIDNRVTHEHDEKKDVNANPPKLEYNLVHDQPESQIADQNEPAEYESLLQVIQNDFGWREIERLLIVIFYVSDFGKEDFNREEIISLYKEIGRDTVSRRRNLSNNLQTLQKYKWIMASSSGYYMTDEGVFRARGILVRDKAPVKNEIKGVYQ